MFLKVYDDTAKIVIFIVSTHYRGLTFVLGDYIYLDLFL